MASDSLSEFGSTKQMLPPLGDRRKFSKSRMWKSTVAVFVTPNRNQCRWSEISLWLYPSLIYLVCFFVIMVSDFFLSYFFFLFCVWIIFYVKFKKLPKLNFDFFFLENKNKRCFPIIQAGKINNLSYFVARYKTLFCVLIFDQSISKIELSILTMFFVCKLWEIFLI